MVDRRTWIGLALVVAALVSARAAAPARGETLLETWRSPLGSITAISADPADGSIWMTAGSGVVHMATDGTVLKQISGFAFPTGISVNGADGSVWVTASGTSEVVHLAADGTELRRVPGYTGLIRVSACAVDGSVWVTSSEGVVHLASDGTVLGLYPLTLPGSLSANSADGTCWVVDVLEERVYHLAADASVLFNNVMPDAEVAVNPTDSSVWVAQSLSNTLSHLDANGNLLQSTTDYSSPTLPSVDAVDGSIWFSSGATTVHLSAFTNLIAQRSPAGRLYAADPHTHYCWVVTTGQILRLNQQVYTSWTGGGFVAPSSLAVNPIDSSVWVTDEGADMIARLSKDGTQLFQRFYLNAPTGVAIDPRDGSVWFANTGEGTLVHLNAAGFVIGNISGLSAPRAIAIDPRDGSLWVGDLDSVVLRYLSTVIHFAADGTELWRSAPGGFSWPQSLSVDPRDGSAWVADIGAHLPGYRFLYQQLVHLSAAGDVLLRDTNGTFYPMSVSVNPRDGSAWVAEGLNVGLIAPTYIAHYAADGTQLLLAPYAASAVFADPTDNTCWILYPSDTGHTLGHIAEDGTLISSGGAFRWPTALVVDPAQHAIWVTDTGNGQVVRMTAFAAIHADFSAEPTSGPVPLTVRFTDQSAGGPTSWSWNFGDGHTSTEQNPTHTYTGAGDYTVTLTVSNAAGSDTAVKTDYIRASSPPAADFTGGPNSGPAPLEVRFTDTSAGDPTAWSWSFGDGGTSTERNPCHTYLAQGQFAVSHTVSNSFGSDTETKPAFVTVTPPAPVADFSGAPRSGLAPLTVAFTDLSANSPTSWAWSFGDGATSPDRNPSHQYLQPGSYTVVLAVSNAAGVSSKTKSDYIVVTPTLQAGFTFTPATGAAPLTVQFTDTSTGGPTAWSWSFGDGATSTEQNPGHTYTAPGRYCVTLTVSSPAGTLTSQPQCLTVLPLAPMASFQGEPTSGVAPLTVQFTDTSTGTPTSWLWDFGDGATSTDQNPLHTFLTPGLYTVTLTVTNAGGSDRARKSRYLRVSFPDVPAGQAPFWALDQILACLHAGLVQGYPDGLYHPELPVTRDQMAVFMARGLAGGEAKVPSGPITSHFPDVANDYWAARYIEYCRARGLLSGYPDGGYHPLETVDRGQMAVFVARARAGSDADVPAPPTTATFPDVPTDFWAFKYIEYCQTEQIVRGYPDGLYHPAQAVTRDQMAVFVARTFGLVQ